MQDGVDPRWACDRITSCLAQPAAHCARSRAAISKWQWPHACKCVSNLLKLPLLPITRPPRSTCLPSSRPHICRPHSKLSGSQCCCSSNAHLLCGLQGQQSCLQLPAASALKQRCLCWVSCCGVCRRGAAGPHDQQSCGRKGERGRRACMLWAVRCKPTATRAACGHPAAVHPCYSKRLPHSLLPPALIAASRLCCA